MDLRQPPDRLQIIAEYLTLHSIPYPHTPPPCCALKKIHSLHFSCRDLWVEEWIVDINSNMQQQILGRDKVTNTLGFQSLLEVATYSLTLSYILDHQKHKKKSAMTGCMQGCIAIQGKLLLNFDSIRFSYTHTEACQLCTGSSQHKEGNKNIYIQKEI
jgi:hypothetical protein